MRFTGARKTLCFALMLTVTLLMTPAWAAAGSDLNLQVQPVGEERCASPGPDTDVAFEDFSLTTLRGPHDHDRDRHRCDRVREHCWRECRHHHHDRHRHNNCVERCMRHHHCHHHHHHHHHPR